MKVADRGLVLIPGGLELQEDESVLIPIGTGGWGGGYRMFLGGEWPDQT